MSAEGAKFEAISSCVETNELVSVVQRLLHDSLLRSIQVAQKPVNPRGKPGGDRFTTSPTTAALISPSTAISATRPRYNRSFRYDRFNRRSIRQGRLTAFSPGEGASMGFGGRSVGTENEGESRCEEFAGRTC